MPTPSKPPDPPERKKPGVPPPAEKKAVADKPVVRAERQERDERDAPVQLPAEPPTEPPGGPPLVPPGKLTPPFAASEGMVPDMRATQSEVKRGGGPPPEGPPVAKTKTDKDGDLE